MKTYKFRNNSCILVGDSHSTSVAYHIINSQDVKNGSDVIHLGDIGIGFGFDSLETILKSAKDFLGHLNEAAKEKDLNVYLQRGNHDLPTVWQQNWEFSNVFLVRDGDSGVFPNSKKALFVGGGVSIDRSRRVVGVDYWLDEITPEINPNNDYSVVFAHDCPEHFNNSTAGLLTAFPWLVKDDPNLIADCEKQRNNMTRICVESGAKFIYGSHFHNKKSQEKNGVKYRCVDINELLEVDFNDY